MDRAVLADALDDEEIHADRRCNEGQLHIDQEHDIEPDGIETQRLDDRIEHRQRDEDDGNCFQHTPQNEKHDIDADEDDPAVHMPFRHERHERLRDLQHSQDIAEEHSADHDGKDHAGCLDGRAKDPRHITDRKAPVDEECDDERIDRADSSGFRRRENAGINTADDDDRQQKPPDIITERFHLFFRRSLFFSWLIPRGNDDVRHESKRQKRPRYDAGHEQLSDGFIGDGTVKDHRNGRRDENAEGTAGSDRADDELSVIAALQHFRDRHRTDSDRSRHGGAGDRRKDRTGENSRDAKTAGKMAHPLAAKLEKPAADLARQHDLAHQDIERHRRQDIRVQRLVRDNRHLRKGGHVDKLDDPQDTGNAQRKGDRHADDKEEDDEQRKTCKDHRSVLLLCKEITQKMIQGFQKQQYKADHHEGLRDPERHTQKRRRNDAILKAHQHVIRRLRHADIERKERQKRSEDIHAPAHPLREAGIQEIDKDMAMRAHGIGHTEKACKDQEIGRDLHRPDSRAMQDASGNDLITDDEGCRQNSQPRDRSSRACYAAKSSIKHFINRTHDSPPLFNTNI